MPKGTWFVLPLFLCAALFSQDVKQPVTGIVTAEKLIIRAKPGTYFENMGSFRKNDIIEIVEIRDNWLRVKLPADVKAWIPAEAVDKDGLVVMETCQLYCGPNVAFTSFDSVKRGTKLELHKSSIAEWHLVSVPESAAAWVNKSFVLVEEPVAEEEPQAVVDNTKAEEETAEKLAQEEALKAAEAAKAAQEAAEKLAQEEKMKAEAAEKAAEESAAKRLENEKLAAEAEKAAAEAEEKRIELEKKAKEAEQKVAEAEQAIREIESKLQAAEQVIKEENTAAEITPEKTETPEVKQEVTAPETITIPVVKKTEPKPYSRPPTFTGYLVPLGKKANSMATHALYENSTGKVQCFLFSQRIPLNEWNQMRVEVSGTLKKPNGWTIPVLTVRSIVSK